LTNGFSSPILIFELLTEPFVVFESVHQCGQHAVTQMAEPSRFSWFIKIKI